SFSYTATEGDGTYAFYTIASDKAGNAETKSASDDSTLLDTLRPSASIAKASGQADPTNSSPIHFTVTFNEPVTGFSTAGVTIGGTANPTTKSFTGSGTTYDVAVSGMSADGTVMASVNA